MADRHTILRHIEASVDVDKWATVGVKENFEKLNKIEQIISERDELDSKNRVCGNRALMDLSKIKEVINSEVGTD